MTKSIEMSDATPAALQKADAEQAKEWERVVGELRALADEFGDGFAVSEAALAALEELTTMDTVPAELPPFARVGVRG